MIDALRNSVAHVFVDHLDSPSLTDTDQHHLSRVLRVRDGERVTASDGRGSWRSCAWADGGLRADGDVVTEAAPLQRVGVAFVPVKGDRNEWSVQKLTEIGIDDIVLLAPTRRSVVRWTDTEKQLRKLALVAREAAMQSRRVWLPKVVAGVSLADALSMPGAAVADPAASYPVSRAALPAATSIASQGATNPAYPTLIVVGPEGGFDDDEIPANVPRVRLGDTILRAETATLVAATLLSAWRSARGSAAMHAPAAATSTAPTAPTAPTAKEAQ
ncbi:MAG: RsmE family RNA methyltransferase [Ilumatobacteraceae bacterium]